MNSADRVIQEFTTNFQAPNQHRYLSVFLIAVIVTALLAGPATVVGLIIPFFANGIVLMVFFIVALESGLTSWWLAKRNRQFNRFAYRTAEVLMIIVLIRMITWYFNGQILNTLALRSYLLQPTKVLDFPFVLLSIIALFAWERGMHFNSIFRKLALNPAEIIYYSTPTTERFKHKISTVVPKNRKSLYQDFLRAWLTGSIILVAFVVISTFDVPQAASNLQSGIGFFGIGRLALSPELVVILMSYFLAGLWLASLGRLHVLQARWLIDQSTPDISIVKFWQRRSFLLLFIITLFSAILPIGSTMAISKIFMTIALYASYIVGVFIALLAYLFYLISSLFGPESPPLARQPLNLDEIVRDSSASAQQSELASFIFGSISWLIIGTIVVSAMVFFFRERGISISGSDTLGNLLKTFLKWLRDLMSMLRENVAKVTSSLTIPDQYHFFGTRRIQKPWSFLRLNSLSPRDQVRYYYLAVVKRAGQKGIRRPPSMTADEFSKDLIHEWPDSEDELRLVTEAFELARYSRKEVKSQDLPPIREAYQKFRKRLNNR